MLTLRGEMDRLVLSNRKLITCRHKSSRRPQKMVQTYNSRPVRNGYLAELGSTMVTVDFSNQQLVLESRMISGDVFHMFMAYWLESDYPPYLDKNQYYDSDTGARYLNGQIVDLDRERVVSKFKQRLGVDGSQSSSSSLADDSQSFAPSLTSELSLSSVLISQLDFSAIEDSLSRLENIESVYSSCEMGESLSSQSQTESRSYQSQTQSVRDVIFSEESLRQNILLEWGFELSILIGQSIHGAAPSNN